MARILTSNRMKMKMNLVLAVLVLLGFGTLIGRLYQIQLVDGERYQTLALKQQLRPTVIPAQRGTIYDRNLKTLAASATAWTVTLSPAEITSDAQLDKIADFLSPLLDVERDKIVERGKKKNSYYEIIKQKIEQQTADAITKFLIDNQIEGVNLIEDTRRYYPYGSLASTVLGFTGDGNKGAYGLESYYEKVLAGTPGMVVSAKNAKSGDMPSSYERQYAPVAGNSLVLTIDEVVQHSLDKHLKTAVVEHNVQNRAVGLVMDVNTGGILAMSTQPDFDPNEPTVIADPSVAAALAGFVPDAALTAELSAITDPAERQKALEKAKTDAVLEAQFAQWRNKAISDPYEPGSVFKTVTAAMALDLQVVSPTGSHFYCPGYHIVAGRRKACWKAGGHGSINFIEAVKFSCNPAFMMIGALIGPEHFYDYFERFGLREATRIDLPGEADSIFYNLKTLSKASGEELASSSFGQTFKVTPLQMVSAVSAVVNGGRLMQPYVVSQVLDPDGNVVSTTEPKMIRQVISEETSETMAGILQRVVGDSDGSGRYAYVPGYRVGGKTGTSEKLDDKEGGEVTKRISSFLGFAPADDPKVCVLVLLDEPHMENVYGSIIAAPVVGAILADILPYLGVDPQYTEAESAELEVSVPAVSGKLVHDAISDLTMKGLKYRLAGDGVSVTRQLPASGQTAPRGSTVILYTGDEPELQQVAVPDVRGLSGQQANRTVLNAGLNIRIAGDGIESAASVAVAQDPAPGTMADLGTVVTVTFANRGS